jgi:hypothetical protein
MKLINSVWTVVIMGVAASLIVLCLAFFKWVKPDATQAGYEKAYADQLSAEGDKLPAAKKRVEKAIKMVNERATIWNRYVGPRTLPDSLGEGGINLDENPYQLAVDTLKFRNNVQRAVNAQIVKGGIKLVGSGPYVPGPTDTNSVGGLLASYYNYPTIKFPVVIYNLGTIVVTGTYDQIIANVKAYKTMPHYLAETDGLRISGTSPHFVGSYQLTIVGFLKAPKLFGAMPVTEASTATTGAGGGMGGAMGGPMGGMMGRGRMGMPGMSAPGGGARAPGAPSAAGGGGGD